MNGHPIRTTIGLKKATKIRLDHSRAPGQCYDGFLCQLISLWEETHNGNGRHKRKEMESFSRNRSPVSQR